MIYCSNQKLQTTGNIRLGWEIRLNLLKQNLFSYLALEKTIETVL